MSTKTKNAIESFLREQESCLGKIHDQQADTIEKIITMLIKARNQGKKIFTLGNGGSASTASHFVSDLLKTSITKGDKRFLAISLTDNIPVMLAWANDASYENIFSEQLKNFLTKGDIVIGFSGSGKSKNMVKAMKWARENGALCIGITGQSGGVFPEISDICLKVPTDDMLAIESAHVTICHCIISAIRNLGKPMFTYG